MKVCLIVPDRPYLIDQKALPHLGVLYVSSALKKLSHDVEVLDFADGWRLVDADIYGITMTTPDFARSVEILKWLKDSGAKRVVAGGPHASLMPNECLEAGFDAVSIGDGELTMPRLNGERICEAWETKIDRLPHPDRSALDLHSYNFTVGNLKATSIMTARGCLWGRCAFCSRWDKHARFHSPEYINEELKDLDFEAVMIYDDEFFSYLKRDREIVTLLNDYGLIWRCFARADYILRNKELVKYASKKGLHEVLIGVESASDEILKTIKKGTTVKMNREAIRLLHSLGVRVKAAIIIGLPGESASSIKALRNFCGEMEPYVDDWDFSILQVYPGSDIYRNPELYDVKFEGATWYKGKPPEYQLVSPIETSNLGFSEIVETRNYLETRFKSWKKIERLGP